MSNMVFLAFMALSWAYILKRLSLTERATGIGDGRIDGYRYSIIQRENRIYIILPEHAPRNRCRETAAKILKTLSPEAEVRLADFGYASACCNYCLEVTAFPYRCRRCGRWYCEYHRLPEEHNCPGGGEIRVAIHEAFRIEEKEEPREVIVAKIPCG